MNAATEWKDIVHEAAKGMVILVIMETLMLTRHSSWLEVRRGRLPHGVGLVIHASFLRRRTMWTTCTARRSCSGAPAPAFLARRSSSSSAPGAWAELSVKLALHPCFSTHSVPSFASALALLTQLVHDCWQCPRVLGAPDGVVPRLLAHPRPPASVLVLTLQPLVSAAIDAVTLTCCLACQSVSAPPCPRQRRG